MCARTIDRYLLEGLLTRRNVSQQAEAAMHIARRRLGLYRERERKGRGHGRRKSKHFFFHALLRFFVSRGNRNVSRS